MRAQVAAFNLAFILCASSACATAPKSTPTPPAKKAEVQSSAPEAQSPAPMMAAASAESPRAALASVEGTSSYVACYFRDDKGNVSWQWGLTSSNAYFSFSGTWSTTPYTKLQKFFSSATYGDLCAACNNAKSYYSAKGTLYAFFAATSNTGSNYPIVLGGNELFSTL